MKRIFTYSRKRFVLSIALIFLAVFFLYPAMNSFLSQNNVLITPDRTFNYTVEDIDMMRQSYGLEGARVYAISRATYDLIWPIIYVFFLVNVFSYLIRGVNSQPLNWMKLLPFGAFVFDLIENVVCSVYFYTGQVYLSNIAVISSIIKWVLLLLLMVIFLLLGIYKVYKYTIHQ